MSPAGMVRDPQGNLVEPLVEALREYLAQFSEGHTPAVPVCRNSAGCLDVEKTLALDVYDDFPDKEKWLMWWNA